MLFVNNDTEIFWLFIELLLMLLLLFIDPEGIDDSEGRVEDELEGDIIGPFETLPPLLIDILEFDEDTNIFDCEEDKVGIRNERSEFVESNCCDEEEELLESFVSEGVDK